MNDLTERKCAGGCGFVGVGCDMHQFETGAGKTAKTIYYCSACCPRCSDGT